MDGAEPSVSRARRWTAIAVLAALFVGILVVGFDFAGDTPPAVAEEHHVDLECPIENPSCGPFALPAWGRSGGWSNAAQRASIQPTDIDGDGRPELIGWDATGVHVWTFQPADETCSLDRPACGSWAPFAQPLVAEFADANGFGGDAPRTIKAVDIDGDGHAEIVGMGANGLTAVRWDGRSFGFVQQYPELKTPDRNGIDSIRVGEVDGKPGEEILVRRADGLHVYTYAKDTGFSQQGLLTDFADGTDVGRNDHHWRTTMLVDFAGDGHKAVVANTSGGLRVWWYGPGGTWNALPSLDEATATATQPAYKRPEVYRALLPVPHAERNGPWGVLLRDVATRTSGINVYSFVDGQPSTTCGQACWGGRAYDGDAARAFTAPDLDAAAAAGQLRVLDAVDTEDQHRTRVAVRTPAGVRLFVFERAKPMTMSDTGVFTDAEGYGDAGLGGVWTWDGKDHGGTLLMSGDAQGIRTATERAEEHGSEGVSEHGGAVRWVSPAAGFPAFQGEAKAAYDALSAAVGATGAGGIRANYALDKAILTSYRATLRNAARPATVSDATWAKVRDQIDVELRAAIATDAFYDQQQSLVSTTFASSSRRATAAASRLSLVDTEHTEVLNKPVEKALAVEEMVGKTAATAGIVFHGAGEVVELTTAGFRLLTERFLKESNQKQFTSKISDMDARMADVFSESRAMYNTLNSQVVESYGWMVYFGSRVESGELLLKGEDLNVVLAGMERGADLSTYATLLPVGYEMAVCWRTGDWDRNGSSIKCSMKGGQDVPADLTSTYEPQPGKPLKVWLNHRVKGDFFTGDFVDPVLDREITNKLFGKTADKCIHDAWTSECAFGMTPADVALLRTPIVLACSSQPLDTFGPAARKYGPPCNRPSKPTDPYEWPPPKVGDEQAPPTEPGTSTTEPSTTVTTAEVPTSVPAPDGSTTTTSADGPSSTSSSVPVSSVPPSVTTTAPGGSTTTVRAG